MALLDRINKLSQIQILTTCSQGSVLMMIGSLCFTGGLDFNFGFMKVFANCLGFADSFYCWLGLNNAFFRQYQFFVAWL